MSKKVFVVEDAARGAPLLLSGQSHDRLSNHDNGPDSGNYYAVKAQGPGVNSLSQAR